MKSNILHLGTSPMWRGRGRFASLCGVSRVLAFVLVIAGAATARADSQASNPPFLGIEMQPSPAGVEIRKVTPNTGAARAGLEEGDVIVEIDQTAVPPLSQNGPSQLDFLSEHITAHNPGDEIHLRVIHGSGQLVDRTAVLSSRADLMQEKIVGHPLDVSVVDVDSDRSFNLADLTGRTTIVGWSFNADTLRCGDCARTLDRIDERFKKLALAEAPRILGVTNDTVDNVKADRKTLGSSLPVARVAGSDVERLLDFADPRRLSLTVIDCRGVAQFVAVILPGASDEDAVIDELVAAVEQANHRARR